MTEAGSGKPVHFCTVDVNPADISILPPWLDTMLLALQSLPHPWPPLAPRRLPPLHYPDPCLPTPHPALNTGLSLN